MKQNITVKINAWIICGILLLTNLLSIIIWQPWSTAKLSERTITVTGTTTIKAEPDQFVFSPYYQKQGEDPSLLNSQLIELADDVTENLKKLGVDDSSIKYDVNNYDYRVYYYGENNENTSTLYFTITINDKTLAQTVLDYLVTTSPSGSITPSLSFSTDLQKQLEEQARTEAIDDAKEKAQKSADQLGARIGRPISISDTRSDIFYPAYYEGAVDSMKGAESTISAPPSYTVQPGLNDYNFSIEVVYEIK